MPVTSFAFLVVSETTFDTPSIENSGTVVIALATFCVIPLAVFVTPCSVFEMFGYDLRLNIPPDPLTFFYSSDFALEI